MIYQKKGQDNKTHLYKTANDWNVTSNDDVQLTYTNNESGAEVDPTEYKKFWSVGKKVQQIGAGKKAYITADDIIMDVWAGDDLVIGGEAIKVTFGSDLIANATVKINATAITSDAKVVNAVKGETAKVTIAPADGYEVTAATVSVGETALTVAISDDGVATATTAELEEDATITATATVAQKTPAQESAPKKTRKAKAAE